MLPPGPIVLAEMIPSSSLFEPRNVAYATMVNVVNESIERRVSAAM